MFAYRFVMALALLNSPPERLETLDLEARHAELAPAVRLVAIHLEILDRKEAKYILADARHFAADLRLLGGRCHDLADAPRLAECQRLPALQMAQDFLAVNRSFQQSLESRLPLDPLHADDVRTVLQENEKLYQVWEAVRVAQNEIYYITVRRSALKELRDLIGAHDYYSGLLPPNVPMWWID
ncbi:MAG: hypothetical protein FJ271_25875 [Planctomycetes bacterium]|nr:hypothetical protein [Planctomycetota bacterium]